ncbi:MAG: phosphatidate cytidylyltransferase [Clostridia bacterium]|nr:phosphatidate cytidylyltransferase [Clostridia bacterium]
MLKRTITGIGIVIVTVGFFLCKYFLDMPVFEGVFLKPVTVGDMLFDLFILIMAVASTYEYERAFSDKLLKTEKVIIFIYPFAVYISYCFKGLGWAFGAMLFLFLLLLAQLVFEYDKISLESIGISLFTMIYPATILVSLLVINRYPTLEPLLMVFAITPCADTFAYFVGSIVKGKKLCPNISPNKTVSGFIGGLFGGMIASLLVYFIFTEKGAIFNSVFLEVLLFAGAGIACALLTAYGDLVESVIKRKLGIKDMGKILPGHGGMSDRIDGLTFAAPVISFVFTILVPLFTGGESFFM